MLSLLQENGTLNQIPLKQKKLSHLLSNFSNAGNGCSIEIVIVLASFNEQMILNVALHLLAGCNKVIVSAISFVFTFGSCSVYERKVSIKIPLQISKPSLTWNAASEFVCML